MTLQDYISKIDAIAEAINGLNIPNVTNAYMTSDDLNEIPVGIFIALCEHYNVEPLGTSTPYGYVRSGVASVQIQCKRVQDMAPSNMLAHLRAIAANTPAQ